MLAITLPDKSVRRFDAPVTGARWQRQSDPALRALPWQ